MTIQKPSIFKLKQWREENGFTTPEWKMYVEAMGTLQGILYVIGIIIGVIGTVGIAMINPLR